MSESVSVSASIDPDRYRPREITLDTGTANLYVLLFALPVFLLVGLPYYWLWHDQFTDEHLRTFIQQSKAWLRYTPVLVIGLMVAGIVLHELIHGLTWSLYCRHGFRSIRFGIVWKYLTPYCHCREPLPLRQYRTGALMPALILGLVPAVAGLITGHAGAILFGLLFTVAAGGDFGTLWLLRKAKSSSLVLDHPDKIGCYLYERID